MMTTIIRFKLSISVQVFFQSGPLHGSRWFRMIHLDYAKISKNLAPKCLKLLAIHATANLICERLVLVPRRRVVVKFVTMPSAPLSLYGRYFSIYMHSPK